MYYYGSLATRFSRTCDLYHLASNSCQCLWNLGSWYSGHDSMPVRHSIIVLCQQHSKQPQVRSGSIMNIVKGGFPEYFVQVLFPFCTGTSELLFRSFCQSVSMNWRETQRTIRPSRPPEGLVRWCTWWASNRLWTDSDFRKQGQDSFEIIFDFSISYFHSFFGQHQDVTWQMAFSQVPLFRSTFWQEAFKPTSHLAFPRVARLPLPIGHCHINNSNTAILRFWNHHNSTCFLASGLGRLQSTIRQCSFDMLLSLIFPIFPTLRPFGPSSPWHWLDSYVVDRRVKIHAPAVRRWWNRRPI